LAGEKPHWARIHSLLPAFAVNWSLFYPASISEGSVARHLGTNGN
jgi:hypothetical protein